MPSSKMAKAKVHVGLMPAKTNQAGVTERFAWDHLPLWRLGASGALVWLGFGLGLEWAFEGLAFLTDYLFMPIALWFSAAALASLTFRKLTAAYLTGGALILAWGPPGMRKVVEVPFSAIDNVELAQNGQARGAGRCLRLTLKEPMGIAELAQLPKVGEPHSAKKALAASKDGREVWLLRKLRGGYGPLAKALEEHVEIDPGTSEEVPNRWKAGDWLLSALFCCELVWIARKFLT